MGLGSPIVYLSIPCIEYRGNNMVYQLSMVNLLCELDFEKKSSIRSSKFKHHQIIQFLLKSDPLDKP